MTQPQKRPHTGVLTSAHGSSSGNLHIFTIPKDMAMSILLFVGTTDLCVSRVVSKRFQDLSNSAIKLTKSAKLVFYGGCPDFEQPLNLLAAYCTKLTFITLKNRCLMPERACKALRPVLVRNPKVKICTEFVDDELYQLLYDLNIEVEEIHAKLWLLDERLCFSSRLKRCHIGSRLGTTQWTRYLRQCHNLEALSVEEVSNNVLQQLVNHPRLASLRILNCLGNNFPVLPHIREFSTSCMPWDSAGMMENIVQSFPNLQTLQICCNISIIDLKLLSHLKKLRVVDVGIEECLQTALDVFAHVKVLKLSGCHLLAEFLRLEMKTKDVSWEWLHFVSSGLDGSAYGWPDIRMVGAMASRLCVLKVNGMYLVGSEVTEPKMDVVAPWIESHFAEKRDDNKALY